MVGASDGAEAPSAVEQQRPFDAFVLDLMVPQMVGDELARELRRAHSDARVYFTGYADTLFNEKLHLWQTSVHREAVESRRTA